MSMYAMPRCFVAVAAVLAAVLCVDPTVVDAQTTIESKELYDGIRSGRFHVVVDVRRRDEWDEGRIEGATFVENMGSTSNATDIERLLLGCEVPACHIAVYCRTGGRAGQAIARLIDEYGFDGDRLYNGRGVTQWMSAGYTLSTTSESVVPKCSSYRYEGPIDDTCSREVPSSTVPTVLPSPTDPPTTVGLPKSAASQAPTVTGQADASRPRCIDPDEDGDTSTSIANDSGNRQRRLAASSTSRCNPDLSGGDGLGSSALRHSWTVPVGTVLLALIDRL